MMMPRRRIRTLWKITAGTCICVVAASSVFLIETAHQSSLRRDDSEVGSEFDFVRPRLEKDFAPDALPNQQHQLRAVNHASYEEERQTSTKRTLSKSINNSNNNKNNTTTTTDSPLDQLKVPYPIFVASLPKSGTTSTARYFTCGRIWTAHTFVKIKKANGTKQKQRLGECWQSNVQAGEPPLQTCGRYKVWSDAGHPRTCFYPSIHGLDDFYRAYPNSTILLVTRNSTAWAKSLLQWNQGNLVKNWQQCSDFFPNSNTNNNKLQQKHHEPVTEKDLEDFYHSHAQRLHDLATQYPSLTFVEVALEDKHIGQKLQDTFGIPAHCWGHRNSYNKRVQNAAVIRELQARRRERKRKQLSLT